MNDELQNRKLNYQLQQMAFQKYPFQINNKTFFCLQTYFQDQLLNGVDLQLKQSKGITSQPQKISYLQQNQQLILAIGSNIVSYNAQKRCYSLLCQINGYLEILRTYSCKINNKTFLYWLETDQQGLNIKNNNSKTVKTNSHNKNTDKDENSDDKEQGSPLKKLTSILDLSKNESSSAKKIDDIMKKIFAPKDKHLNKDQSNSNLNQKQSFKLIDDDKKTHQIPKKGVKFFGQQQQPFNQMPKQKSKKKVRIQIPPHEQTSNKQTKKRMRICLFDYQKHQLFHKQQIQIEHNQTISDIILFYTSQKMIGYVINDQVQLRAKIYYKKIKIEDSYCSAKASTNKKFNMGSVLQNKKKNPNNIKPIQKFKYIESIFEIPLLKYNGQTDQYLFKDLNTIYSLQLYQIQHQMYIKKGSSKNILLQSSHYINAQKQATLYSKNSIQISDNQQEPSIDQNNLSRQIQKVTKTMLTSSIKKDYSAKQKFSIKISQQVELYTDEIIVDLSLSQTYLVVLTNQYIRFYSIFNLNTLLFKCEIHNVEGVSPPCSVQLNKSYLLLVHQNSTFVSSYTILERKLKYNSTCELDIEHCQSILKLFMNTYNCQIAILARQYQIQGRMTNILKSKKIISNNVNGYKKSYIDISLAYINFSSTKCQTKNLFLKNQRFRNILTCKWHSQYLIQTENQILAKQWRQSFQNLKCSCLHPTGQYLIIGFNDCFKIYSVTQEGLQNTYMSDGVKDCQSIAYSEYGEHFAVSSSNTIVIYNSYNSSKKLTITLPMGSLIQSLQYRSNHLLCILKSKRIIIYHVLLDYKQIFTFNPKNYLNQNKHQLQLRKNGQSLQNLLSLTIKGLVSIQINSLYYDIELNVIIFSSGKKIFFLNTLTNESLGSYDFEVVSNMEYNKHLATLFLGTAKGEIIAFPWPNKPSNIMGQLPRFKFHSQRIIKIKLTSDYKHLITLGNDMSIYKSNVSYILNLKRLKGSEIAQYKGNKNAIMYCNFLYNKGFCQFSHSQNIQKLENKKQLEEQVVNTIFMLPQQRLKQKQYLFEQISTKKQQLNQQNTKQYQPLQQQSSSLRNKIIKIKQHIINTKRQNERSLEKQKIQFDEQTSKYLKIYSQLNYDLRMEKIQLQEQKQKLKYQNQKQYKALIKQNLEKENEFNQKLGKLEKQNIQKKKDFRQIQQIEHQKHNFIQKNLLQYNKEIQMFNTKNGQLSCKNSTIQKQILILKYRIQQLKFVILNANSSIQKLKSKQKKQTQQKKIFQHLLVENAKIDVSEMQKKYIKTTKELIQKNKQIDINLTQYEKQKQILIQLEKTVQNTEQQINKIVESLQEEKKFMKFLISKYQLNKEKSQELMKIKNKKVYLKNSLSIKVKRFVEDIQKIQKDFQIYNNSSAKKQVQKADQLLNKVKLLENTYLNNARLSVNNKTTLNNNEKIKENTNSVKNSTNKSLKNKKSCLDSTTDRNHDKQNQTLLGMLIPNLKKSSSSNSIKDKKFNRCITQGNDTFRDSKGIQKIQSNTSCSKNGKIKFKINHSKFRDQFNIYRKDDLLTNTTDFISPKIIQNKQLSTQKPQQKLKKTSTRYYQIKTQSNATQRAPSHRKQQNGFFKNIEQKQHKNALTFRNSCSYDRQKEIQFKKQSLFKQLTKQNKHLSKIKTDKKLFMTSKKKLNLQNQDLLYTYNSLTCDNKYYQNILKAYQQNLDEEDKNYIFNNPVNARQMSKNFLVFAAETTKNQGFMNWIEAGKSYNTKGTQKEDNKVITPFDKYLQNKQNKMVDIKKRKLNEGTQGDKIMAATSRDGFKTTLSKVKPTLKTASQKRIKTIPCVELNL